MHQELNDFYRYHKEILVAGVLTKYYDSELQNSQQPIESPRGKIDGKPIVVALHGVATSSYLYRNLIAEFEGSVRLIIPDLPGYGRSTKKLPWAAKYKHYYGWLEGFLRTVLPFRDEPVKAHFIGHDFGALLAMAWAVDHQEEVSSLFCINTCVHLEHSIPSPYIGISLSPFIGQRIGRFIARDPILPFLFRQGFKKVPDKKVIDAYMSVYKHQDARIILSNFMHHLPGVSHLMWHIRRHLKHLDCPSFFVFGMDDIFVRSIEARSLAEPMPNAAYRCLPGVGHFPTEEVPDAINAEIAAHFSHLGIEC